jgi:N-hydroxyarylamine O-acetyltransferase
MVNQLTEPDLERYLTRIGVQRRDASLEELQRAHQLAIPYENVDVQLGREIRLDLENLVAKLVDRRRGGYCYEHNTLFAAALESLGFTVTRCLGRVRFADAVSPRPATHMVLIVDGELVDVGFGSSNPLGPLPLGGEATYGWCTWSTERAVSPEGEDVWLVRLFEMPLYTFTESRQHPVDYIAPNHFSSTHPHSIFTQALIAARWTDDGASLALVGRELTERRPGRDDVTLIEPADLGAVLRERFLIDLDDDELSQLLAHVQ